MAESVGEIYFDVDADTGGLLASAKQVDSAASSMERSIDGVQKRTGTLNTQMTKTAKGVNHSFGMMRGGMQQFGYQIQDIAVQLQMGQNALMVFGQQGSQIASIFGPGGAVIGALLAVGAALGTALLPSLFSSKSALEDLEASMEKLGVAVEVKDDVALLTEEIQKLARVSQEAAQAQLAQEIVNSKKAIQDAAAAINEALTEDITWGGAINGLRMFNAEIEKGGFEAERAWGLFNGQIVKVGHEYEGLQYIVSKLNDTFGLSQQQAFRLVDAVGEMRTSGSPEAIQNLQTVLGELNRETGFASQELVGFQESMREAFLNANSASEVLKAAEGFMADFDGALRNATNSSKAAEDAISQLIGGLITQSQTLGMNERQLALYAAQQLGASESVITFINSMYDSIEAKQTDINKTKESDAATRQAVAAYERSIESLRRQNLELTDSDKAFETYILQQRAAAVAAGGNADEVERLIRANRELKEQSKEDKETEQQTRTLTTQVQTLGLNPLQELDMRYQQELDLLRQAEEQKIEIVGTYQERRNELERQYQEQRARMMNEETQNSIINFESLGNRAAGAFAAIATGAQDGTAAIHGLSVSVLQEAIGSLLRMGFESIMMQEAVTGVKTASEASQAVASASRLATETVAAKGALTAITAASVVAAGIIAKAWATPAALASVATGGLAVEAGIGTLLAGISAGVPAVLAAGSAASSVAGAVAGGGRMQGGAVSRGRMYPVTEDGAPELFEQGGRQYLMTGSKGGRVVSSRDLSDSADDLLQPEVQSMQALQVQSPQLQAPEIRMPELQAPELQAAQLEAPQIHVPQIQAPSIQAPQLGVPQLRMPEMAAPSMQSATGYLDNSVAQPVNINMKAPDTPNVNVNINAPAGYTGEASVNMRDGDIDIDARIYKIAPKAVANDLRRRGDVHKAVTETTNASNKARGR